MNLLSIQSPHAFLNEGFAWARELALGYVQTGKPGCIDCYWAGLLDRRGMYIRDYVHQAAGAHLLGLQRENLAMLKAFAVTATASRQWYPIWCVAFDGDIFHMDYHHDGNFAREIPMTFELVEVAHDLYRRTGDAAYFRDPALWDFYTHAVTDFITVHDHRGDGIAAERGATWPYEGICTYNEAGQPLVQAADGLASQYQAFRAYGAMQRARGDSAGAIRTEQRAAALWDYFQTEWWLPRERCYARGRTPDGQLVGGTDGMPNLFMVLKYLAEPGPRSDEPLDRIEKAMPYKPDGGAPCTSDHIEGRTYLPQLFHAYGRNETAWKRLVDLLQTRSDYPEVCFTVISHVVEGLLGVEADAPIGVVATLSRLPEEVPWCEASHVTVGGHDISVRHQGHGESVVEHHVGSGPITWEARFEGAAGALEVDGQSVTATTRSINGRPVSSVRVTMKPGARITVRRG